MFNISLNPYKSYTDEELLAAYKESGNNKYIGELFKRYQHLVIGMVFQYFKNKEDAKDTTMEIFEQVLQKIDKHDIKNFKGWLYILSKNFVLQKLRGKMLNFDELQEEIMEKGQQLHLLYDSNIEMPFEKLEAGIQTLTEQQRICVQQFYLEDKSYKEISDITGYDLNAIKSFIQNGKRNLKNFLNKTT